MFNTRNITERKQAEEKLAKLNKFSAEMAMLPNYENLEAAIVKELKDITGAEVAIFSEFDPIERISSVKEIEMEPGILQKVIGLLGKQVKKYHANVSEEIYHEMTTEIIGMRKTLYEASFGAVSQPVSAAIQALLKVDRYFGLAFMVDGELYGTSLIAIKRGQPIRQEKF
jgi:GAF domain-containing protein